MAKQEKTKASQGARRSGKVQMNVWLTPEERDEIQQAARAIGMTTAEFVTEACRKAANELVPSARKPHSEEGEQLLSATLRRLCTTAERGGSVGYADVGYEFAIQAYLYPPDDIGDEDWLHEMYNFIDLLREGEQWAIVEWTTRHYPDLMAAVPARRRLQFAAGAIAANGDQRVQTPPQPGRK